MDAQKINVAIDGPAGAGKSTVARMVAARLGFVYVDTGAMYRAITWKAIQLGLEPQNTQPIVQMAEQLELRLIPTENGQQVLVDGYDVSEEIRYAKVNERVPDIAQIRQVRELLSAKQKQIAAAKGVVMDGRDIGTHVLPDAEVKIFLTASVEERARRRYREMLEKGQEIPFEQLKSEISRRDRMDEERDVSPLTKAKDAEWLDSTGMSIGQVVEHIVNICKPKMQMI